MFLTEKYARSPLNNKIYFCAKSR